MRRKIHEAASRAIQAIQEINGLLLGMDEPQHSGTDSVSVELTDEFNPVRILLPDAYADLSFEDTARLWISLGRIRQVREHAEDILNG